MSWNTKCVVPVTKIGIPALAATNMVPETVVPPFSFCSRDKEKWRIIDFHEIEIWIKLAVYFGKDVGEISSRSFQARLFHGCQNFEFISIQSHMDSAFNYSNRSRNSSLGRNKWKLNLKANKKFVSMQPTS